MSPSEAVGPRQAAAILDVILYAAACAGLFIAMAESTHGFVYLDSPQAHIALNGTLYYVDGGEAVLWGLATLVLGLAQFGVLPGLTAWTPGKLAVGVRVWNTDGSRPGVGKNLLRAVTWIGDGFPYFVPGLVGFVMILSRSDKRRLADLAAETVVAGKAWRPEPLAPPSTASAPGWLPPQSPEAPERP